MRYVLVYSKYSLVVKCVNMHGPLSGSLVPPKSRYCFNINIVIPLIGISLSVIKLCYRYYGNSRNSEDDVLILRRPQKCCWKFVLINTLGPKQNDRQFPHDTFKRIFLNKNVRISIKMKFVPKVPIDNIPALDQIMAWRSPGNKPLSEPMMISSLTYICVTRPQWVNPVPHRHSMPRNLRNNAVRHTRQSWTKHIKQTSYSKRYPRTDRLYMYIYSVVNMKKHFSISNQNTLCD